MTAQSTLRRGGSVLIEGINYVMEGDGLPREKDDLYIAERNVGPLLLTVKSFCFYDSKNSREVESLDNESFLPSWINPNESAYAYDFGECVKVKEG